MAQVHHFAPAKVIFGQLSKELILAEEIKDDEDAVEMLGQVLQKMRMSSKKTRTNW